MSGTRSPTMAWTIISLIFLASCHESGGRLAVEGSVSLDGTAIPKGSIAFVSASSPSAGAEIVDGHFAIPAKKGLLPGQFRVEIRATRATGKTIKDPLFGATEEEMEYLPPRYNTKSELTADISESNANQLLFELKSK